MKITVKILERGPFLIGCLPLAVGGKSTLALLMV